MKISKYFISFIFSLVIFFSAHVVSAATIYLSPDQGNFNIGDEVNINIKINSEGESVNAGQASLNWPSSVLKFIETDKTNSVFNFWVDEPKSSTEGSMSFIGGTSNGISGEALQILKVKFKAIGGGVAEISLSDAAITAADGKGTNVLSVIKGAAFAIGAEVVKPQIPTVTVPPSTPTPVPAPTPKPAPVPAPEPEKIVRPAVPAAKLPQAPSIKVPLYENESVWHSNVGETVALWDVPNDIISIAVQIDHSPNTEPKTPEKELYTGKKFGILEEDIWYIHVRFRNNIGWGPTTHYKISLDTQPPLSFKINGLEGEATDNPAPELEFQTTDALSGLSEYQIKINNGEALIVSASEHKGVFKLPLQEFGKKEISVKAFDFAGNSTEDMMTLEILPIASPVITFITKEFFSNEEAGLILKGTALPNANVLLNVYRVEGQVATTGTARSNDHGNWDFTFEKPLQNGQYVVKAQSQDDRGAVSLIVESDIITVKSRPIIQIGSIQLGKGAIALILLFVLFASAFGGAWFYRQRQRKIALRVEFAQSETAKMFKIIEQDVDRLSKAKATPEISDDEYALKSLQGTVQKMGAYVKKGIEKIKK